MSAARKPWARMTPAERIEAVRALEAAGRANSTIALDLKAPRAEVDRICAALRREREAQASTVVEAPPAALSTVHAGEQPATGGDDVERSAERVPATPPAPEASRPNWRTLPKAERDRLVKAFCAAGLSASKITARFDGATRNAVVGVIHRLKAKGEIARLVGGQVKSQKRRERQPAGRPWAGMSAREKDEAVAAARKEGLTCSQIAERHATKTWSVTGVLRRVKAGGHVDPARSTPTHAPQRRQASPSRTARPSTAAVIALPSAHGSRQTTSAMIDAWLAKNGGPRRFEARASTDILSIRAYLMPKGYDVVFLQREGGVYTLTKPGPGRPAKLDRDQFFAFVDRMRVADGLTPFLPQHERTSA